MIRYQTKEDRRKEFFANLQGDTNIHISLITVVESNEENPAKYVIRHCRYFPKTENDRAHWGTVFYTDGKLEGFPNGFQTIEDVRQFVAEEVERLRERVTKAIINNDYSSPALKMDGKESQFSFPKDRWETILKAWEIFQKKLEKAIADGSVIDYETAKKMQQSLEN